MQSSQPYQYPSTQSYQYPYKTDQYPSHADLNNEWDIHGMHDDEAFLNGNPSGRLSPAVAARERYMARKEAAGSPYGYGANAATRDTNRGCFAGKKKWIWLGALLALIAIIAGAVAGILISRNKSSASEGVTGAVKSDSSDPSVFTKNPSLHKSFYGLCYTPLNAQYPACGDTIDSVIEDIQLLSQLTTRLRLYGSDCDVTSLVLEAIQKTKVNMTIFPAAWLPQQSDDPDNVVYNRQVSEVQAAIKTYGVDNIEGITVGNEFLLNGGSETELIAKMAAMRSLLKGMNLPKTLPVGTADAGSMVTTTLSQGSDYVMANVHPWFGGVPIDQAADWVYSYTANQEPSSATLATNDPKVSVSSALQFELDTD
jgi:exo-beta-1,3-glucanase (GH17 family)